MSNGDRLGRGLGALLGDYMQKTDEPLADASAPTGLPVRAIAPNPFQPRRSFDPDELGQLAISIKVNGLLQPILVRRTASGRSYELVAGERRLRACKQLGWNEIPAQVREVDDRTLLVLALVENIQREELGPLEEAEGYHALRDNFGYTQQEIADAVGKSRSAVANMLRLRTLPPSVRRMVEDGSLSMGHGRAILGLDDPIKAADFAREAAAAGWSVRETEERVRNLANGSPKDRKPLKAKALDPAVGALEVALGDHLGTRVSIRWKGEGRGTVQIAFKGARELERVFAAVTGQDAAAILA